MITSLRRAAIGAALVGSALLVSGAAAVAAPTAPATPAKALSSLVVKSQYFTTGETTLTCDPGQIATGGGVGVDDRDGAYVSRTEPFPNTGTPTGWKGAINNLPHRGGGGSTGSIYVVCAKLG